MGKIQLIAIAAAFVLSLGLSACAEPELPVEEDSEGDTFVVEDVPSDGQGLQEPQPEHSALYVDGVSPDDTVSYFMEVCLGAEFVYEGDVSGLQKWTAPITFRINGNCTAADRSIVESFVEQVNTIEGFPGLFEAVEDQVAQMDIYFCSETELLDLTGFSLAEGEYVDGAVRFWAFDDEIHTAIVCCRDDIDQDLRNSVILEELYNGLGPVQDSELREDSIIYQYGSEIQEMSDVDMLLLRLLYHPAMICGMDASECEKVIRDLYW